MLFAIVSFTALDCASPVPCARNSECPIGYYCSESKGQCVKNCVDATRDCDPGEICNINGQCVSSSDDGGAPDGNAIDSPAPNDTSTQDNFVSDTSTEDVIVTGSKIELDLCAQDADCKTGLICRALYRGGPTRCAPTCTQNAQCRSGARCLTLGNDTYCADADVGKTCSASTDCNYGCLTPGSYCTTTCLSGSDCPNGFGCATVGNNGKLCVRAEEYCGQTNNCTLDCDTSGLVDSCTLPCTSSADCPQRASILSPWTCSTYCERPSDVYGPLAQGTTVSWACNAQNQEVNLCSDAQHVDFVTNTIPAPATLTCPVSQSVDGATDDICVDTCRYSGACSYGYECSGVGDITNTRVGLCTPSHGSGEVGASCTTDGDCAFGLCDLTNNVCSRDCSPDGICPTGSTCTAVGGTNPTIEGITFKRCE